MRFEQPVLTNTGSHRLTKGRKTIAELNKKISRAFKEVAVEKTSMLVLNQKATTKMEDAFLLSWHP